MRTVLTSTIGIPDASSSSCRSRFSSTVTPAGGRLASAELPPVKQARTRSSAAERLGASPAGARRRRRCARSAAGGRRRAPRSAERRRLLAVADGDRPAVEPVAEHAPRARRRSRSVALPAPTTTHARRRGRAGTRGRRRRCSSSPSSATAVRGRVAGVAGREAGLRRPRSARAARLALAVAGERLESSTGPPGARGGGSAATAGRLRANRRPPRLAKHVARGRPRSRRAPRRSGSAGCTSPCARRGPARRS